MLSFALGYVFHCIGFFLGLQNYSIIKRFLTFPNFLLISDHFTEASFKSITCKNFASHYVRHLLIGK